MKKMIYIFLSIVIVLTSSCSSTKSTNNEKLYDVTWQLEFISGPRIAFEGLFPDMKPTISFTKEDNKVQGNTGCNGYAADYTLNGNQISFGEPGPTTMMFCGEGENQFLNMMRKVDGYNFDADGKLNLMMNEVPFMRFKNTLQSK